MAWSIAEVARMSGTTSRTLRHYHDIELLAPAFVGANGYRYYEREQLRRLQEIMLLRELGLGLAVIGRILNGQQDAAAALHAHLRRLRVEQARILRLQRTVERTLRELRGDTTMPAETYFDGFDSGHQEAYERELIDRYGDDARQHIERSRERTAGWTENDYGAAMADFQDRLRQLAALKDQNHEPASDDVQALIGGHHEWLTTFWTADRESYTGLAELYTSDDRFRDQIESVEPGLAAYLREAMTLYAERRLS